MRTGISPHELLPKGLQLENLSIETGRVSICVSSGTRKSVCPLCGRGSFRVHSRYLRTVSDLSWHGISVELKVRARRYFCDESSCERKIFCERLPEVAARARKTSRLEEALLAIALELGGRAGARLALELGILTARDALLRRIKAAPLPEVGKVRVLGVDDFAFKKGSTYGTILVNLEDHKVVDLLAERSQERLVAWFRSHPARAKAGSVAGLSPTAKNVAALFMRHEEKLGEEQEEYLGRLCEADEALADTRRLTQEFTCMVRRLEGEDLDGWLKDAEESRLAVLVVGAALAWGAWELLLAVHPESASTLHFPDFEGSMVAMAAIYGVAVVAFVAASRLLSRWIGALELAGGALVWLVGLSLATAFFEPLFSAVALWPLVGGVVALAVVGFYPRRAWAAGALLALAAVPGPVLVVPLLVFETIKVEDGAVIGVASLLLLLGGLLVQLLVITGGVAFEAETGP